MSTARHIGLLTELDVGATVWSRTRQWEGNDGPVGGVVLQVLVDDDPETGERRRRYRVYDIYRHTRHVLDEADVDLDTLEVSTSRCVTLIRRFCADVAFVSSGRVRRGPLLPEHADAVADAHRLVAAVMS